MPYINNLVGGFLMGIGLILAALVMRLLFHIGFCG